MNFTTSKTDRHLSRQNFCQRISVMKTNTGVFVTFTPYCDHSRCGESDSPEVGPKPTCAMTTVRPFPDGKEKTTLVPKSILLDYYYTFTFT